MGRRRGNNEGSITKRPDGRWQGSVTIPDASGKNKRKYFYGSTKKAVLEKMAPLTHSIRTGTYTEPSDLTLGEWMRKWLDDYKKHSLRPRTWESYNDQFENHILNEIGRIKLAHLRTGDLQKLYNDKLKDGARLDGKVKGLSPTTVRYIHRIINNCLEQAKKEHLITINPADAVVLPKKVVPPLKTWSAKEATAFLETAKGSPRYCAFLLALLTGMRRGEILALKWADIDLKQGTLQVRRGLVRTKDKGLVFQEPKTELSKRSITIGKTVIEELKALKRYQNEMKLKLGPYYNDQDLVFATEQGNPLEPNRLNKEYNNLMKKADVPRIKLHALRHTFATLSIQQGTDIKTVQNILGHHSAAFTLDVYSQATDKMKKEASDRMESLLASRLQK